MSTSDRIGVIGGGLGGLAAACTLAARGLRGRSCSRRTPGSAARRRCSQRGRLPLRHGADHPDPAVACCARIFAEAGRDLTDDLDLVRARPAVALLLRRRHARSTCVAERRRDGRRAGRVRPGQRPATGYRDFLDFARGSARHLRTASSSGSRSGLCDMFDLRSTFKPATAARRAGHAHGQHGRRRRSGRTCRTPRSAQMLDHFTQYVGSSPDALAGGALRIAHMQTGEGVWYPEGGTARRAEALAKLAGELGVESAAGVGVPARSLDDDGAVTGVVTGRRRAVALRRGRLERDAVRTHRELLGGDGGAAIRRRKELRAGLLGRRALPRARPRATTTCSTTTSSSRATRTRSSTPSTARASRRPTRPATRGARRGPSPSVAPRGGEALYVLVHTPYLRPHHDWTQMFPAYRRAILDKLKRTAGHGGHRGAHRRRART